METSNEKRMSRRRLLNQAKYAVPAVVTLAMARKSRALIIVSDPTGGTQP
jgi:hypothetical protein